MTATAATIIKATDGTCTVTIKGVAREGFAVVRRDATSVELRRTSTGILERVVVASGPDDKPAAVLDLSHPDAWAPPPETERQSDVAPVTGEPAAAEPSPAPAKPSRRGAATAAEPVTSDSATAPAEG